MSNTTSPTTPTIPTEITAGVEQKSGFNPGNLLSALKDQVISFKEQLLSFVDNIGGSPDSIHSKNRRTILRAAVPLAALIAAPSLVEAGAPSPFETFNERYPMGDQGNSPYCLAEVGSVLLRSQGKNVLAVDLVENIFRAGKASHPADGSLYNEDVLSTGGKLTGLQSFVLPVNDYNAFINHLRSGKGPLGTASTLGHAYVAIGIDQERIVMQNSLKPGQLEYWNIDGFRKVWTGDAWGFQRPEAPVYQSTGKVSRRNFTVQNKNGSGTYGAQSTGFPTPNDKLGSFTSRYDRALFYSFANGGAPNTWQIMERYYRNNYPNDHEGKPIQQYLEQTMFQIRATSTGGSRYWRSYLPINKGAGEVIWDMQWHFDNYGPGMMFRWDTGELMIAVGNKFDTGQLVYVTADDPKTFKYVSYNHLLSKIKSPIDGGREHYVWEGDNYHYEPGK